LNKYYDDLPVTEEEEKRVRQLDTAQNTKHWKRYYRNTRAARDDEYYSWRKTFLQKRRQDFVASILKGEGGSTYDALGDAAYCERLVELENEYDCNFSLSLSAIPVEEMEEVYNRIENNRNALRDATAALAVGTLKNGYIRRVPLPRVPRIQSTSPVACATIHRNHHAYTYAPMRTSTHPKNESHT
jgi:hypothetical protein